MLIKIKKHRMDGTCNVMWVDEKRIPFTPKPKMKISLLRPRNIRTDNIKMNLKETG
jgi:hypothetical protein